MPGTYAWSIILAKFRSLLSTFGQETSSVVTESPAKWGAILYQYERKAGSCLTVYNGLEVTSGWHVHYMYNDWQQRWKHWLKSSSVRGIR